VSSAHRHHRLRSASDAAPFDELVVSRPSLDRGIDARALAREIRDRRGHLWTLREKGLTRAWTADHLASKTLARAASGWLLFENGLRRVVVTPPPARWQEWDDGALVRLLEHHARQRPARRRATATSET